MTVSLAALKFRIRVKIQGFTNKKESLKNHSYFAFVRCFKKVGGLKENTESISS